ncbi:YraN family protein [Raineyella sp. LH-20]|uniref:YraN family protein n=1 Tax=Raineyella sp. LH-20 TaxID=3081204 RepID=UPI0029548968|nr:YraN family protein [Raineyella sp. LH-20]WOP18407.1 YraN family protein [Raineyella sp. LH-20]
MDQQRTQERRALAVAGEDLAVAILEADGSRIIARNWRCRAGEVDVFAVEDSPGGPVLVVCEVKTRVGMDFGDPLEAITPLKVARMRAVTVDFLAQHGRRYAEVRFDAIGIVFTGDRPAQVTHLAGVA